MIDDSEADDTSSNWPVAVVVVLLVLMLLLISGMIWVAVG